MRGSWPAISACKAWCFFSRFWTPIKSLPEKYKIVNQLIQSHQTEKNSRKLQPVAAQPCRVSTITWRQSTIKFELATDIVAVIKFNGIVKDTWMDQPRFVEAAIGSFSLIQVSSSSMSRKSCWRRRESASFCLRATIGSFRASYRATKASCFFLILSASKCPASWNWRAWMVMPSIRS